MGKILKKKKARGFTLVAIVLITVVVVTIAVVTSTLLSKNEETIDKEKMYATAKLIAEAGMQQASPIFKGDRDWSDNAGTIIAKTAYMDGTYVVTGTDATVDDITLVSEGDFGDFKFKVEKKLTRVKNASGQIQDAFYLKVDTANISISQWNLQGIVIENIHPTRNIIIDKVTITWYPESTYKVTQISVQSSSHSNILVEPYQLFDISNYIIRPTKKAVCSFKFNEKINNKNLSFFINYMCTDKSSYFVEVGPLN